MNTKAEDMSEIKKFTDLFEKKFKEKLSLEIHKRNSFQDYLGRGAESIYTNPIPKDFVTNKWRKNPRKGMLWIETDINPNGITGKNDIGRTYTIKFEQVFSERRKYARQFGTGMIHHFYSYGRTIDEILEKFENYLLFGIK